MEGDFSRDYFPPEEFAHVRGLGCPCKPYYAVLPMIGAGVVHRKMNIESDTFPVDWIDDAENA